ncbi:helix-turn-helix domain-containing protein [bacterium]|nr:helix-turn-helix domain-containing protein [bacterium]
MKEGPDIARIAALIGDPARANMLTALMSGKALTVSELAQEAGVTIQTASSHLSRMEEGGLLRVRKQGRHKYFTYASDDVAHVIEALMGLAAGAGHLRKRTGPRDESLRRARVCYNHLAGDLGTRLYDSLLERGFLDLDAEGVSLTDAGANFVTGFGIDLEPLRKKKVPLCRACLDWSERRPHLAGSLGRAFLGRMEALSWVRRDPKSRAVHFSARGDAAFAQAFPTSGPPSRSAS